VADLAFVDQSLERPRGLGKRDLRVRPVHLEEVDVVDAERLETLVESLAKPVRAGVADEAVVGHPQAALGRDHHLVAAVLDVIAERLPEHSLGGAEAVAMSGVEEVDSQLARLPDRRDPLVLVELPPLASELPGAEGDRGDLEFGLTEPDCVLGGRRHRAPFVVEVILPLSPTKAEHD
jgi:hypothetical protein